MTPGQRHQQGIAWTLQQERLRQKRLQQAQEMERQRKWLLIQQGLCPECSGKGKGWIFTCSYCNGTGRYNYR